MKQTENYQLSQWELADRIQMEDFNGDNAKVDAALGALAATVAKCGNCKIKLSSYTGTGTYGINNPTRVQFPKTPLFFIIRGRNNFMLGTHAYGTVSYPNSVGYMVANEVTLTWSGHQVIFFNGDATGQMNESEKLYEVIGFYAADAE